MPGVGSGFGPHWTDARIAAPCYPSAASEKGCPVRRFLPWTGYAALVLILAGGAAVAFHYVPFDAGSYVA